MISQRLLFLLALFLCVALPTAAGVMATPYLSRMPPVVYPEPVKIVDRVEVTPLPVKRVPVVAYRLDPPKPKPASLGELVHAPWPCEQIRKAVETFGREAVKKYAKSKGYTKKQIDEAMMCLDCGPERYDRNRDAYEKGRPQPC